MDKIERKPFSKKEKEKILSKTNHKCAHCGKVLDTNTMTIEHIYPVSKGGTNDEYNILALCEKCNMNKLDNLYEVKQYYKYILPKYLNNYVMYNHKMHSENNNSESLLKLDTKIYEILGWKQKRMLYNMIKRGAKKKQIIRTADSMFTRLKLERTVYSDIPHILNLIDYLEDKDIKCNMELYKGNKYLIKNTIQYGDAYTLRCGTEIHGAFLFMKASDFNLDFAQLNNIEDNLALSKKYIMTFGYVDLFAYDAFPYIMEDMYLAFIKNGAIPLYFNMLNTIFNGSSDVISLPLNINGIDGKLEFFTIKGIKETLKDRLENSKVYSEYSDDELDSIVEYLVVGKNINGLTEEEKEKHNSEKSKQREKLEEAIKMASIKLDLI